MSVAVSKFSELFDSFTFNVTASIVSIAVLADYLISMIAARSFARGGVLFVVWIVIAYHFISVAYKEYRQKTRAKDEDAVESHD